VGDVINAIYIKLLSFYSCI